MHCVVDTSVWISLHTAGVLPNALQLIHRGWTFCVTEFIARELREPDFQSLAAQGVQLHTLSTQELLAPPQMLTQFPMLSAADTSLIVAAQTLEATILTDERPCAKRRNPFR